MGESRLSNCGAPFLLELSSPAFFVKLSNCGSPLWFPNCLAVALFKTVQLSNCVSSPFPFLFPGCLTVVLSNYPRALIHRFQLFHLPLFIVSRPLVSQQAEGVTNGRLSQCGLPSGPHAPGRQPACPSVSLHFPARQKFKWPGTCKL